MKNDIDLTKTLSTDLVMMFINQDVNSDKKKKAKIGERYYDGEHDIRDYKVYYVNDDNELVEDTDRSNIKISHAFFTELVDQKTQYLLSSDEEFVKSDKPELQSILNEYFGDKFKDELAELVSGASKKGFDYMYCRTNAEGKFEFKYADGMGVIEVRAKDNGNEEDDNDYIIYHYVDTQQTKKGVKEVVKIEVWDKEKTYYYQCTNGITGKVKKGDNGLILDPDAKINPRPHLVYKEGDKYYGNGFDFIPFWRLDNNRKQTSDLKPIKALIDDYDLMSCGLSNNLQDISEGIYVVKGFNGGSLTDLQKNIKTKKIVGVGKEGDVDIRTINIPYQARQAKLDLDEKNIYRFGMGLNTSGLKDANATTNLMIKAAYALLDLKCNKIETKVKSLLWEILKPVLKEINDENKTEYSAKDIYIEFKRETITNDTDNANVELLEAQKKQIEITTILSIASLIPDEIKIELIFEQLDLDYEEYKDAIEEANKEKRIDINSASETLANAPIEGDPIEEEVETTPANE